MKNCFFCFDNVSIIRRLVNVNDTIFKMDGVRHRFSNFISFSRMPFTLVITKEGGADAVSAVPSGWVNENTLYWPKTGKKAEIEALRCDENGKFNQKWRKQKCRIKMKNIATFAEATKLEEMYANFEDTEEEEA